MREFYPVKEARAGLIACTSRSDKSSSRTWLPELLWDGHVREVLRQAGRSTCWTGLSEQLVQAVR
ncbi:hypothetical protein Pst134EB_027271 [Puccinia striiformis f. sp. tritici]|uniref:Uncharacterized protein n=1 Tax=Puccinia striiformis f. sp. tritici PST-78 TaxID=1165861 RepID=A0A0L0W3V6_9BASI|nr:hypothetical protein Pst134EB_027271 [Puccinia striiformis f. sp. tritici]KNF06223.1 hypothetical protein PSTG_00730 [Puccinia striiformis f. sp. tritici PST-78]